MAGINNNPTPYYYGRYNVTGTGGVTGTPGITGEPTSTTAVTTLTSSAPDFASDADKIEIMQLSNEIASLTLLMQGLNEQRINLSKEMESKLMPLYEELAKSHSLASGSIQPLQHAYFQNQVAAIQNQIDSIVEEYTTKLEEIANQLSELDKKIASLRQELDNHTNHKVDIDTSPTGTVTVTVTAGDIRAVSSLGSTPTTSAAPQAPTQTQN